jgi:3-hydroxyacyl-CoA dehydrogenase/enoyl-CoA hydratase/3-hydroxybutyryl-CoA epimerase
MSIPTDPFRVDQTDGVATVTLRPPGGRFDLARVRLLNDVVRRASRNPDIRVLVLRGDGLAGFAPSVAHESLTGADRLALAGAGQRLTQSLLEAPCVTVADLSGACHGPALELALACDRRFAVATPQSSFGFPESRVGLFPSWGGVSLLLATLGVRGTSAFLTGVTLSAREAYACGLVDVVCGERRAGIERRTLLDRLTATPRKAKRPGAWVRWRNARALVRLVGPAPSHFAKPLQSLIRAAASSPVEGRAAERACFAKAMASGPVVAAFALARTATAPPRLNERTVNPVPDLPHVIGVTGLEPGLLRLAAAAAMRGTLVVTDGDGAAIRAALAGAVKRGFLTPLEATRAAERVRTATDDAGFERAGLLLTSHWSAEAVGPWERRVPPRCVIAVAGAEVEPLQDAAARPGRVVGLGVPVPTAETNVVEVARGPDTTADTTATVSAWLRALGATTVAGSDRPGLTVRRVLFAYWDEAVRIVSEGVPVADLDAIVRANGTARGPLEQLDGVGFERAVGGVRRLMPLLAAGLAGRVGPNSYGFYRYKRGTRVGEYPMTCAVLWDHRALAGEGPADPLASLDMLPPKKALAVAGDRLTMRIVNEAAGCLHDDELAGPAEIDLAVARGADLLPHAGGPLRFADKRDPAKVVERLNEFAARYGERFRPSPELIRRAAGGEGFYELAEARPREPLAIRAA